MLEVNDTKNEAVALLSGIPVETKREMVIKSRFTCESHWMMAMVFSSGWKMANKMNLQVAQAVAKAEMHRLMKALGKAKPGDDSEFLLLTTAAMEAFMTKDYFEYEFRIVCPGRLLGVVNQCYAYTKVSSIKVDKDYQCGCFGMRAGWYEAMGVQVEERLVKCLKEGADRCEIEANVLGYDQI